MKRCPITSALLAAALLVMGGVHVGSPARAASTQTPGTEPVKTEQAKEEKLSPEETMRRRFPQPAPVRALIGRPVLDDDDNTIGTVQRVVRTPDGKILLIVRYGGWFGWIGWWQRPVAVPIERVAVIGPNVAAVDMPVEQFQTAPTWQPAADIRDIAPDEIIRVAITRR